MYSIYDTNTAADLIGSAETYEEAQHTAQELANRNGRDTAIMWLADGIGTTMTRIPTQATADELEAWAMSDAGVHDEYFAPTFRTTQRRYDRGNPDAARKNAERKSLIMMEAAAIRYDYDRATYSDQKLRFRTDTIREAAQRISDYIMEEIENGNRY